MAHASAGCIQLLDMRRGPKVKNYCLESHLVLAFWIFLILFEVWYNLVHLDPFGPFCWTSKPVQHCCQLMSICSGLAEYQTCVGNEIMLYQKERKQKELRTKYGRLEVLS